MQNAIHLWGDSIGKGVIYDPIRQRYCLAKDRCEKQLTSHGIALVNHSRMGATVIDGYADFAAGGVSGEGLAVIEFGGNDCDLDWQAVSREPQVFHDGKTPLAEFGEVLRLFARDARARGLEPVFVLPPPLHPERYFDWVCRGLDHEAVLAYLGDVGHIGRWHACYVEAIRQAARDTDTVTLDLYTPFMRSMDYSSLFCEDGIHPSSRGQHLIAMTVMQAIADGADRYGRIGTVSASAAH